MKIILTQEEVETIISDHFRKLFGVNPTFEIARGFDNVVNQIIKAVNLTGMTASDKINRIKALRKIVSEIPELAHPDYLSLCNSKYAVENWDKFVEFMRINGRLPRGYYTPTTDGDWMNDGFC